MNFTRALCFLLVVTLWSNFSWSNLSYSQSVPFKRSLFLQGLKSLEAQKAPERLELENALVAALYVDANTLVEPLVSQFSIPIGDYLSAVLEHSETLDSLEPVVERIRRSELSFDEVYVLSALAFKMGRRDESLAPLFEASDPFFGRHQNDPEVNSKAILEEISYSYALGSLHRNRRSNAFELASDRVKDPILSDHLQAFSIWKVQSRKVPVESLGESLSKIKSVNFRNGVLLKVLSEMKESTIKREAAYDLVKELVITHFASIGEQDELYTFAWELDSLESLSDPLPKSGVKSIIKIGRRTGCFESDVELLKFIESVGNTSGGADDFIKDWALTVAKENLDSDHLGLAKVIAREFKIELPPLELANYSSRNNRSDLVESDPPSSEGADKRKGTDVENAKAASRLREKLAAAPESRKLRVLTEFVWTCYCYEEKDGEQVLAIEDEILAAFDGLKDQPEAASSIAKAFNIFLGTGQANRRLLQKMMTMIPAEKQVVTVFQINNLENEIRDSTVDERNALLDGAMQLIQLSQRPGGFGETRERLAFAFAMVGDEVAVRKIIDQMEKGSEKTWTLFQCAKAFPPQGSLNADATYIRFKKGGMF